MSESEKKRIIAVTMGDPAGVGPEVILRAFGDDGLWVGAAPVVYGDLARLQKTAEELVLPVELVAIDDVIRAEGRFGTIEVIDFANVKADLPYGEISGPAGRAALDYIETAAKTALSGKVDALVTAPISKAAIRRAGSQFNGHTDMLAAMAGTSRYAMTLVAGELRCMFATDHIPYADVPTALTRRRILETIELAAEALATIGEPDGVIAVLGLNPHAGESGYMGSEEDECIVPAIREARDKGIRCDGPIPADTAFHRMKRGEFAMAVAMYHDQGHAPLKLVAFDTGVNWTVGLPFVRTSPDHGTAFDIAGKGKARAESFRSAYNFARRIVLGG
jgi:4-hydroxythreonine-4-phosphate dehydrogenase